VKKIAIIGGGPGGLMVAEKLAQAGCSVTVFDRKPSLGRKFLMAGRGGLNLTHSEPLESFLERYGVARSFLENPFVISHLKPCGHGAKDWGRKLLLVARAGYFPGR